MSKTFNTKVFSVDSMGVDAVSMRDFASAVPSLLTFKRQKPTRSLGKGGIPNLGTEKTEVKYTAYDSTGVPVAIRTVSTSIIAGTSDAVRTDIVSTMNAALADAVYSDLVSDQRLPLEA